jgi:SAM-dependent methyltransferase
VKINNKSMKDVSHYDNRWTTHVDSKEFGPYARHMRRLVKSLIYSINFSSLLDVGCGPGILIYELGQMYPDVKFHGIDISTFVLEIAKEKNPGAIFQVHDITKGHLNKKFDLVTCVDVIEHIDDDVTALKNLSMMTEKYLIVGTIQGTMRKLEPIKWGHVRNYTKDELSTKIINAGLSIVNVKEWGYPFFSPIYRNLIDLIGEAGVGGSYGPLRILLTKLIYSLFLLNSHKRGDVILLLAEK